MGKKRVISKESKDLMELIDKYIFERGYKSRSEYLKKLEEQKLIKSVSGGNNWINGACSFKLARLKSFVDNLDIPLEELVNIYGRDPFKPPIQEFKQSKNPLGKLVEWYIEFKTGKTREGYLKEAQGRKLIPTAGTAINWVGKGTSFPLYYIKAIVDDLHIPLEELIEVYGRYPFKPPIQEPKQQELKQDKNLMGKLIDKYIRLKTGKTRIEYLKEAKERGLIEKNVYTVSMWIKSLSNRFALLSLKGVIDDLGIPTEDLIEIYGRDPFKPPIQEFKQDKNPIGQLIDWYIEFKTGKTRNEYLKEAERKKLIKSVDSAYTWIHGSAQFNILVLKSVIDDLDIPTEDLIEIYGRDPFKPPIQELKQDKNPIGQLIDWYIPLKTRKTRNEYLKEAKERGIIENLNTANAWINGLGSFNLTSVKRLTDDLGIPIEDLIEIYGRDPFKPPIEEIKKSKNPIGQLIDWYIEFKTGKARRGYLIEAKERGIIENPSTVSGWIGGMYSFPSYTLKLLVDDLKVPYDEVNQFIDYDISKVQKPIIVDDDYINKVTKTNLDHESVKYILNTAREFDLDESMKTCISDIIIMNSPELLYKKSKINEKISGYLPQHTKETDFNPNPTKLIKAIEDLMISKQLMDNIPDHITTTLTELTTRIYHQTYKETNTPITQQIEKDIQNTEHQYTKNILQQTQKFFQFTEGPLKQIYQTKLKPTIQNKKIKTTESYHSEGLNIRE